MEIAQPTDKVLSQIIERLTDPMDRKTFSEVSKQWYKVEAETRRSLHLRDFAGLHQVLPRYPNLVTFLLSGSPPPVDDFEDEHFNFIAQTCPRLECIDLKSRVHLNSMLPENGLLGLSIYDRGIANLPELSKVVIRGRMRIGVHRWIRRFSYLTHLDLGECQDLSGFDDGQNDDLALREIGRYTYCLRYLNLELTHISDHGLFALAKGESATTLNTLVLRNCRGISDMGLEKLQHMKELKELDLSNGYLITDKGVSSVLRTVPSLEKLHLSGDIKVTDTMMEDVDHAKSLRYLDVSDTNVTRQGIGRLRSHKSLERVVFSTNDDTSELWKIIQDVLNECKSLESIIIHSDFAAETMPDRPRVRNAVNWIVKK